MQQRPIQRLSDEVIGQIAAGEVVERPAAAVKELVENSIDAGATAVTVELRDGGISYIRVSDNGRGIPSGEVRMAFERHATSKLSTAQELFSVQTLGFRGEALASIAAVAKVTCTSRTEASDFGVKAQVEAGAFVSLTDAASPVGTTIVVRELFYNAPVRLKFLKKPALEAAYVSDYIMRLILSRPEVAIRFVNQGKTVYRSSGDGTLESALYCVYGREALQAMRPVHGHAQGVMVDGFVGVGELARGNRLQQSFFVNGRYFRDEPISRALERGTEGYVMIGRFPCCALMITLPYSQVDVNVHPNKLEVRFQNPEAVQQAVESCAREALRTVTVEQRLAAAPMPLAVREAAPVEVLTLHPEPEPLPQTPEPLALAPNTDATSPSPVGEEVAWAPYPDGTPPPLALREPSALVTDGGEALLSSGAELAWPPQRASQPDRAEESDTRWLQQEPGEITQAYSEPEWIQESLPQLDERVALRYIGAAFKTYLLFEAEGRLLMVDQHAAHERVLYDRFLARYEGTQISQRLLTPRVIRLTAREVTALLEAEEALSEAGFELEAFDATTVTVRAIPVILGEQASLHELLADVLDEAQGQRGKLTQDRLRRRVAQMACKHAIKGGDTLSQEDVRQLLSQMLDTGAQPTCPHGRPIVSELSQRELEKRFKRIQ